MTTLDRAAQLRILSALAARYPQECEPTEVGFHIDDRAWTVNAMYLHEHELLAVRTRELIGRPRQVHLARITARGMDFLQDDGGLGAVLGVVTVRLEADTLKALLAAKVDASDLPAKEKSRLKTLLRDLGEDALKQATTRLLDAAMDQWPAALQLLQRLIG